MKEARCLAVKSGAAPPSKSTVPGESLWGERPVCAYTCALLCIFVVWEHVQRKAGWSSVFMPPELLGHTFPSVFPQTVSWFLDSWQNRDACLTLGSDTWFSTSVWVLLVDQVCIICCTAWKMLNSSGSSSLSSGNCAWGQQYLSGASHVTRAIERILCPQEEVF